MTVARLEGVFRRWAPFVVQAGVSFVGLALCGNMLASGHDPAVYLPMATALVAFWLPAPRPPADLSLAVSSQESVGCVARSCDWDTGRRSSGRRSSGRRSSSASYAAEQCRSKND